jgi:hypothetical protein
MVRGVTAVISTVSAVAVAFAKASADNRAALIGYLPAGFPTVDGAIEAARAMAEAGADIIEIGLPYSDPLMDGPVIAEAVQRALAGGSKVADVLRTVEAVASQGVAVLIMTYWNPVDRYGVAAFARDLAAAGGSGLITPDLTVEEAGPWLEASDSYGLDRVFLVAPSSTDEPGHADSRAHRPAGRRRPRRQQRRPGRAGRGLRRRGDRGFRFRPPPGPGRRQRCRQPAGRPGSGGDPGPHRRAFRGSPQNSVFLSSRPLWYRKYVPVWYRNTVPV